MDDPYHPRNVTVRQEGGKFIVYDATSGTERASSGHKTREEAEHRMRKRQGVVKGARTQRARKAKEQGQMNRNGQRAKAAAANGVTWEWLTEELSHHEADSWLGLDD